MFGFGSKSAQTPSESSQQSPSNADRDGIRVGGRLVGLKPNGTYNVIHKWRKVGDVAQRGMPHHSQIFVTDVVGNAVLNFGLFANSRGIVVFENDNDDPNNPYNVSKSYRPNPLTVTGEQLSNAYDSARRQCGPEYKLLHNNCQKFGRLLMTALGASHHRDPFHP